MRSSGNFMVRPTSSARVPHAAMNQPTPSPAPPTDVNPSILRVQIGISAAPLSGFGSLRNWPKMSRRPVVSCLPDVSHLPDISCLPEMSHTSEMVRLPEMPCVSEISCLTGSTRRIRPTWQRVQRAFAALCVCLSVVAALSDSRASAGCGDYIRFRSLNAMGAAHGASGLRTDGVSPRNIDVAGHNQPHRTVTHRNWFSVTLVNRLSGRESAPADSHDPPCRGPACQRQPFSPTVPPAPLVWLATHEALIPADRIVDPPALGRRRPSDDSLSAIVRPSVIFRPPR